MTHWDIARAFAGLALAAAFFWACALAGYTLGGLIYFS